MNQKKKPGRSAGVPRDAAAQRLDDLKKQVRAEAKQSQARSRHLAKRKSRGFDARAIALEVLAALALVVLPFLVYVRTSVLIYNRIGGAPWVAVLGALVVTMAIVAGSATLLTRKVTRSAQTAAMVRWVAAPMAAGWLLYSLLFLASVNAKSDAVRSYYSSLHPVLRAAVSTAIILDGNAVITDLSRTAADYTRMGLPVNDRTRHYLQKDGYVHAVDIRTIGRGALRNRALQFYFWAMGFSTTRHVGTADHLHVQLR